MARTQTDVRLHRAAVPAALMTLASALTPVTVRVDLYPEGRRSPVAEVSVHEYTPSAVLHQLAAAGVAVISSRPSVVPEPEPVVD